MEDRVYVLSRAWTQLGLTGVTTIEPERTTRINPIAFLGKGLLPIDIF